MRHTVKMVNSINKLGDLTKNKGALIVADFGKTLKVPALPPILEDSARFIQNPDPNDYNELELYEIESKMRAAV